MVPWSVNFGKEVVVGVWGGGVIDGMLNSVVKTHHRVIFFFFQTIDITTNLYHLIADILTRVFFPENTLAYANEVQLMKYALHN